MSSASMSVAAISSSYNSIQYVARNNDNKSRQIAGDVQARTQADVRQAVDPADSIRFNGRAHNQTPLITDNPALARNSLRSTWFAVAIAYQSNGGKLGKAKSESPDSESKQEAAQLSQGPAQPSIEINTDTLQTKNSQIAPQPPPPVYVQLDAEQATINLKG